MWFLLSYLGALSGTAGLPQAANAGPHSRRSRAHPYPGHPARLIRTRAHARPQSRARAWRMEVGEDQGSGSARPGKGGAGVFPRTQQAEGHTAPPDGPAKGWLRILTEIRYICLLQSVGST
jgi:hypothetical protein